jgi:hypothetical protein
VVARVVVASAVGRQLVARDLHQLAGRQGSDPLEQGLRWHHVAIEGPFDECALVEPLRGIDRDESLDLRREEQMLIPNRVVQRLDAEVITDQGGGPFPAFVDREGEDADEVVETRFAPFSIGVQDYFGVALGAEPVAPLR